MSNPFTTYRRQDDIEVAEWDGTDKSAKAIIEELEGYGAELYIQASEADEQFPKALGLMLGGSKEWTVILPGEYVVFGYSESTEEIEWLASVKAVDGHTLHLAFIEYGNGFDFYPRDLTES